MRMAGDGDNGRDNKSRIDKSRRLSFMLSVLSMLLVLVFCVGAAAGSRQDPLVTVSWVDQYVAAEVSAVEEGLVARLDDIAERLAESVTIKLWIGKTQIDIDGETEELEAAPYLTEGGRTMVPLRALGEALGAEFAWDGEKKQVIYRRGETVLVLTLGSATVLVNGVEQAIDAPPQAVSGRTFVPLRVVTENLGFELKWDNAAKQVTLIY